MDDNHPVLQVSVQLWDLDRLRLRLGFRFNFPFEIRRNQYGY